MSPLPFPIHPKPISPYQNVTSSPSPFSSTLPTSPPSPPRPPDPNPVPDPNPSSSTSIPQVPFISPFLTSNQTPLPHPQPAWTSLFKQKPSNAGKYTPVEMKPTYTDGVLNLPPSIVEEGSKIWSDYLVGFFLDAPLSFTAVVQRLKQVCKLKGSIKVKSDGVIFLFLFSCEEDKLRILNGDPIIMKNKLFIIKSYDPKISNVCGFVHSVPVWVHFHNIPLFAWSHAGINRISSKLRKLLCLDSITESLDRLQFAKCLVEIRPDKELVDEFWVKLVDGGTQKIRVTYLWKPLICTKCVTFGHLNDSCEMLLKNDSLPLLQFGKQDEPHLIYEPMKHKVVHKEIMPRKWQRVDRNRTSNKSLFFRNSNSSKTYKMKLSGKQPLEMIKGIVTGMIEVLEEGEFNESCIEIQNNENKLPKVSCNDVMFNSANDNNQEIAEISKVVSNKDLQEETPNNEGSYKTQSIPMQNKFLLLFDPVTQGIKESNVDWTISKSKVNDFDHQISKHHEVQLEEEEFPPDRPAMVFSLQSKGVVAAVPPDLSPLVHAPLLEVCTTASPVMHVNEENNAKDTSELVTIQECNAALSLMVGASPEKLSNNAMPNVLNPLLNESNVQPVHAVHAHAPSSKKSEHTTLKHGFLNLIPPVPAASTAVNVEVVPRRPSSVSFEIKPVNFYAHIPAPAAYVPPPGYFNGIKITENVELNTGVQSPNSISADSKRITCRMKKEFLISSEQTN